MRADGQDSSREPDDFRGLLLRYRRRTGLIQRDLATSVGVSMRSLQDWEAGLSFPSSDRLEALLGALLQAGGLTPGREMRDARELWQAVARSAPRMHVPFDEDWFAALLGGGAAIRLTNPSPSTASGDRKEDWGEAPDTATFVGRAEELALIERWLLAERSRLIVIRGMGGIGKTMLAAKVAQTFALSFERVYWRSLRNAPPVSEWLAGAIAWLSDQRAAPPASEPDRIIALLELLRARRCLILLDNSETLFEPGEREARYRNGMEGYGRLLQAIGEASHQSCLVLTSREAPPELVRLTEARELELGGLSLSDARALLADKQLIGDAPTWSGLVDRYAGNGLALKIVGETIRQVFDGDISAYRGYAVTTFGTVFGGIRRLLDAQAERLSPAEMDVLVRLAVEREPITVTDLLAGMAPHARHSTVIEAIEALRRRSLVERGERGATFTLQSMVLEYVTDRLVEQGAEEIAHARPRLLIELPFMKAQAKEYVRQTQERLIGQPILQRLNADHSRAETERRLLGLLETWRGFREEEQGFGPGNVVNLLCLLRGDLRGLDLSRLTLRQVYLQGVNAQDSSLAGTRLMDAVLDEAFAYPTTIALSADGAYLVAGTANGEVRLWRTADRTLLLTGQGHTGAVWGVAVSADGGLVASGSVDGTVRLWNAHNGQLRSTLQGHTSAVRSVASSADGQLVASASVDGTAKLWDANSSQLAFSLEGHAGAVWSVAISADGSLAATGSWDGTVRLWATHTGELLGALRGHTDTIRGLACSADGRLVVSGSVDATVKLWDAENLELLATLRGHTAAVWGVALSGDGRLVVSGSVDGTVRLCDVPEGRPILTLRAHATAVRAVAMSGDGRVVASGGVDGTVKLWEASSGYLRAILQGHTGAVWSVTSASENLLASGGDDANIRLWDAATGRELATLEGHAGVVYGVALSSDGQILASGSVDRTVRLWQAKTGRLLAVLHGHDGAVWCIAIAGDGSVIASGSDDGTIRVWEGSTGQLRSVLVGHTGAVWGVSVNRDGRVIATGGDDGTIRIWDATSGVLRTTLLGHTSVVYGVALSPDASLLASGGVDGTARLWETQTGQLLATFPGHTGLVRGVALTADGKFVGSSDADGTVRLWEAATGRLLAMQQGHSGVVWDVALSHDERLLLSGGDDGTVKLWDIPTGGHVRTLASDRRYQRMDITRLSGVTEAQRDALLALGAFENAQAPS